MVLSKSSPDFSVLRFTKTLALRSHCFKTPASFWERPLSESSSLFSSPYASRDRPWRPLAFGFILGGALGNLADRLFRGDGLLDGHVIDWVNLSVIPTFNVADTAVTFAVGLLLIQAWRTR